MHAHNQITPPFSCPAARVSGQRPEESGGCAKLVLYIHLASCPGNGVVFMNTIMNTSMNAFMNTIANQIMNAIVSSAMNTTVSDFVNTAMSTIEDLYRGRLVRWLVRKTALTER